MRKILLLIISAILFFSVISTFVLALPTNKELDDARQIIQSKSSCDILTNDQLEIIGEYIMENQHPGLEHERMHQMMGLSDGSSEEEQFHINLAKMMYCRTVNNNYGMMSGGMMGRRNISDIEYSGNYYRTKAPYYLSSDLNSFPNLQIVFFILLILFLIVLALIIYLLIQRNNNKKRRSR